MGTEPTPTFLLDRKWPLRIALVSWFAAGVAVWFAADRVSGPGQVVLAGLWLVGLGLLLRQFILSLFGPVLAYDVLRVGRKPRRIWFRLAYVILLAFLFAWVYFVWYESARWRGGREIRPRDLSQLAEMYFAVYMVVQFILVCVLTPASVAGAIAEEKERRTLEFMLATDLRDREILFGKFASRVGSLLFFLLAGLPVLALLQFFGGIDPDLVVAGFVATLMTVLSLAALAIAASVLSRKARDAIALTYLLAVAYILLSFVLFAVCAIPALRWQLDSVFGYTITSEDFAYPFVAGNPFFMVSYVMETRGRGGPNLFTALGHYTLFHTIVIVLFVAWAGWRLRAIALLQTFGSTRRPLLRRLSKPASQTRPSASRPRPASKRKQRPDVGDSPILWKEIFVDSGLRIGGIGRVIILGLVGLSFVPVALIFWFNFFEDTWTSHGPVWSIARWQSFGEGMNTYLRFAGTVATTLVFLAIAVRGAGTISGERDRHTLDALLTTPLSARTIVWGKWWGCILGMRWAWAWIFFLWVLGLASGGVHPIMFPAAIVSIAIYASGFAWIGVACSLHAKSTLRATMAAIVTSLFAGGGYFLIFVMCCAIPLSFADPILIDNPMERRQTTELAVDFFCSFSPPVNLAWLPLREFDEWETRMSHRDIPYAPFWVLGLVAWGLLSFLLSQASVNKFRRLANRGPAAPVAAPPRRLPPPLPRSLLPS